MSGPKKKVPAPAAAPKAAQPPAKQAAPPQAAPQPTAQSADEGKDFSATPAEGPSSGPLKPLRFDPTLMSGFQPPNAKGAGDQPELGRKLAQDPLGLIDWAAMRQPFLTRGVMWGDRDGRVIEQNWAFTYNNMIALGMGPQLAAKIANIGTPLAYDFSLGRDHPTTEEKMDQDMEKMLGPGKKLDKFVVPIITPDILSFFTEKLTGKKIDFHF